MAKGKVKKTKEMRPQNYTTGFTLLETLVAIAILMIAIGGVFTIAPQGISAARFARNQITASYLAQEAVEVIRNKRDNGMYFSGGDLWLSFSIDASDAPILHCIGFKCIVDARTNTMRVCSGDCPPLEYKDVGSSERIYGHDGDGGDYDKNSIFTRTVEIKRVITGDKEDVEIAITVTVAWKEAFGDRDVVVRENLFNWWN